MGRLRAAMQDRYKSRDEEIKIHTPRNLETLELTFRSERVAKVSSHITLDNFVGPKRNCLPGYRHARK